MVVTLEQKHCQFFVFHDHHPLFLLAVSGGILVEKWLDRANHS